MPFIFNCVSTFFYLDPPYLDVTTTDYEHPTIDVDVLHSILTNLKGKFLLSYNDHPLIRKTFRNFNIKTIDTLYTTGGEKRTVNELIISNY